MAAYHPLGLPSSEHGHLLDRHRISNVYNQRHGFSSSLKVPQNQPRYSRSGGSTDSRVRDSDIKYATRKALGGGFDFSDESYESLRAEDLERQDRRKLRVKEDAYFCASQSPYSQSSHSSRDKFSGRDNVFSQDSHRSTDMSSYSSLSERGDSGYGSGAHYAPSHHHRRHKHARMDHSVGGIGHNPLGRDVEDVANMLQHMRLYGEEYGPQSRRRIPAYHETKDAERRPIPLMQSAVTPLRSKFSWDDSE